VDFSPSIFGKHNAGSSLIFGSEQWQPRSNIEIVEDAFPGAELAQRTWNICEFTSP
jgi:hypothetical protein